MDHSLTSIGECSCRWETINDRYISGFGGAEGIGSFGGSLSEQRPGELGAHVARAAIGRARIEAARIGNVVFGNVIHTEPRDAYAARIAAIGTGVLQEALALTVNRLCGSGMQAIVSAAQGIMLGDGDIALAGGTEVMSRAPYFAPSVGWGRKMVMQHSSTA